MISNSHREVITSLEELQNKHDYNSRLRLVHSLVRLTVDHKSAILTNLPLMKRLLDSVVVLVKISVHGLKLNENEYEYIGLAILSDIYNGRIMSYKSIPSKINAIIADIRQEIREINSLLYDKALYQEMIRQLGSLVDLKYDNPSHINEIINQNIEDLPIDLKAIIRFYIIRPSEFDNYCTKVPNSLDKLIVVDRFTKIIRELYTTRSMLDINSSFKSLLTVVAIVEEFPVLGHLLISTKDWYSVINLVRLFGGTNGLPTSEELGKVINEFSDIGSKIDRSEDLPSHQVKALAKLCSHKFDVNGDMTLTTFVKSTSDYLSRAITGSLSRVLDLVKNDPAKLAEVLDKLVYLDTKLSDGISRISAELQEAYFFDKKIKSMSSEVSSKVQSTPEKGSG